MALHTRPCEGRPLRADAARNRELILAAAEQVFAAKGVDAALEDVAIEAGVGVGTLYRRFPRREDLVEVLFVRRIEEIAHLAEEAAGFADEWKGLVWFLEQACGRLAADRGLTEILLSTFQGCAEVDLARERISPAVDALVHRAQAAGSLRADLATTDVPMVLRMVAAIAHLTRDESPDVWRRYLTLTVDGMRARGRRASALPSPALTEDQVQAVMSRTRCGDAG